MHSDQLYFSWCQNLLFNHACWKFSKSANEVAASLILTDLLQLNEIDNEVCPNLLTNLNKSVTFAVWRSVCIPELENAGRDPRISSP